jgi:hypothetical protein
MPVVLVDVVLNEPAELRLVPADLAVEQLATQGEEPSLMKQFATGVRGGALAILMPSVRKISSNASMNCPARSRASIVQLSKL